MTHLLIFPVTNFIQKLINPWIGLHVNVDTESDSRTNGQSTIPKLEKNQFKMSNLKRLQYLPYIIHKYA